MDEANIGKNIKKYRLLKGWTQEQLANESGLSKNAIYNYENERRIPNIEILNRISMALEVDSKIILMPDDEASRKKFNYSDIVLFNEVTLPKLEKLISEELNETKKYFLLGLKYYMLGKYDNSIQYYKKSIKIDNTYIDSYLGLGDTFCEIKEYKKAIECYEKAIEFDSDWADAYVRRDNAINLLKYQQLINKDIMITSKFSELNSSLHTKIYLLNDDCLDLISNLVDKLIKDKNNLR
ncbi:helix-turn-helix domain-containing protein [Clostridioides difficile]|nr:helix-turn-helix transcriptional regulator [Clostridioides difficile]HEK5008375.1 helix-turn-helix transcriptional regulator [Clostridioides difficile]HEK8949695.1 helix-turn-helix transcriptional regulator [Clostridioides difficile]